MAVSRQLSAWSRGLVVPEGCLLITECPVATKEAP